VDLLLATIASDSHTWNLIYIQLAMQERGHRVTNLGPCVPDDLLVETCLAQRPDVAVISSVNGHGRADGERMIARLRAHPELADLPVVIGGKLSTDGADHT
jgi:methylaspartate mutase sigma subunit